MGTHVSVLLHESIQLLNIKDGGTSFSRYEGVDYGTIFIQNYLLEILWKSLYQNL